MSFEHLLAPLQIGPIEIRNRIVSTSHQTSLVADSLPTDDLVAYHQARAAGGAGLLSVEASAPDPSGQLSDHQIAAYRPEVVPMLAKRLGTGKRLLFLLLQEATKFLSSKSLKKQQVLG